MNRRPQPSGNGTPTKIETPITTPVHRQPHHVLPVDLMPRRPIIVSNKPRVLYGNVRCAADRGLIDINPEAKKIEPHLVTPFGQMRKRARFFGIARICRIAVCLRHRVLLVSVGRLSGVNGFLCTWPESCFLRRSEFLINDVFIIGNGAIGSSI